MGTDKKNNGFTLIETLVSINLAFIAISLVFSFYLFVKSFYESFSSNYIEKYSTTNFFYQLEKTLNNSDEYYIQFLDEKVIIHTNENDSIIITADSISLNGVIYLTDLQTVKLRSSTDPKGVDFTWAGGVLSPSKPRSIELQSQKIHLLSIEIERIKKKYTYVLFTPSHSINHFTNQKSKVSNQDISTTTDF